MPNSGETRKIILITPANKDYLENRFGATDDDREPMTPGYILVAPFNSEDQEYDLLTPGLFHELFAYTGKKLENGFLEVKRR